MPVDVASMAAARDPSPTAPPTPRRDGFHLISRQPIVWDVPLLTVGNDNDKQPSSTALFLFQDITYHISTADQCARIALDRPEKLHAFRPQTVREVQRALEHATEDPRVAVIVLTSNNNEHSQSFTPAFCAGGDQTVRSNAGGYQDGTEVSAKLRVLDLQIQMRRCPKPIVAQVVGYCLGGGHILHMLCDLTLAADNAVFGQTGPRMGSFDAGYGCKLAADLMGPKRARELWMLCKMYSATQALQMGLVNAVVPWQDLEAETAQWIRRIVMNSPTALACCKAALNAAQEGAAGMAQMGGELTRLFYLSRESQEGRDAFLEKRAPQFRSML